MIMPPRSAANFRTINDFVNKWLSLRLKLHYVFLSQHLLHGSVNAVIPKNGSCQNSNFSTTANVYKPIASIIDTIDINQIKIELAYRGPTLNDGKITREFMRDLVFAFFERRKLHEKYVFEILRQARDYFRALPNVVDVFVADDEIIFVAGETHGDIYALLNLFEVGGGPPSQTNRFIFNGNMIDEEDYSIECLMLLLGFSVLYPHSVFLNRGTFETRSVISWHRSGCTSGEENWIGQECQQKYPAQKKLWAAFMEVFDWLPLAHLVNGKVLVVHGGLASEEEVTLDDIRNITRHCEPNPKEVGRDRILYDVLYSSPQIKKGRGRAIHSEALKFGPDITKKFCQNSGIQSIIVTHKYSGQKTSQHHNQVHWVSARYGGFILKLRAPELQPKRIDLGEVAEPKYGTRWRGEGGYYEEYRQMRRTITTQEIPKLTDDYY